VSNAAGAWGAKDQECALNCVARGYR
jgi:hypothetical protein